MCEECEQAGLANVYVRKMNRYGWRPPLAAASQLRLDDAEIVSTTPVFACAATSRQEAPKVEPCV